MEERAALRWIAGAVGARSRVVYLPIDREEQRRRVTRRFATTPDRTFPMSDVELVQWQARFDVPDDETWPEWASQRWPSLPDQYATRAAE